MKLVIGCLNSKYIHLSSAPWCLGAGLRNFAKTKANYEILESTVNGDLKAFAEKILNLEPDVVSFSCYIWNINATLEVCRSLKEKSSTIIVLGGPEVAYRGAQVLENYPYVDYVLAGEGEFNFPLFIDGLNEKGNLEKVPGLTYRDGAEIKANPEGIYDQTPPSPFNDDYFQALNGRICYIESSRGCPYRCAFCLSGRVSPLRFFDMSQVKADLLRLAQSGTQTVKFVDRTFNANENHANEILSFIQENYGRSIPEGICFHFEIAGDILKESTLEILKKMPPGAVQLEIGMQSFNEETLSVLNRKINIEKLTENIRKLVSFKNMHIHIDLIAGLTGEGWESFEKSFNIGFGLGAHMLQMGFLKLLHGAPMRMEPEKYPCEFSKDPPYEVVSTPWLKAEEIICLKNCEDALERLYNSGRFLFTLDYLMKEIGYEPFQLFNEFGNQVFGTGLSLGEYALMVYHFFAPRSDSQILREKIVSDLLCCSSALQIPAEIKISDPRHKKAMAQWAQNNKTKVAILEKSQQVIMVDQQGQKDLFGRYPFVFYSLTDLDMGK